MKIQVNYTVNDIYEALKLGYFQTKMKYLLSIEGVLIIFAGLWGNDFLGIFIILMGLSLIFYPYWVSRLQARSLAKKDPAFRGGVIFEFDKNGFKITSEHKKGSTEWAGIPRVRSNEKILLLYQNYRMFNIIPRHVVSDGNWTELTGLLKKKVADFK